MKIKKQNLLLLASLVWMIAGAVISGFTQPLREKDVCRGVVWNRMDIHSVGRGVATRNER